MLQLVSFRFEFTLLLSVKSVNILGVVISTEKLRGLPLDFLKSHCNFAFQLNPILIETP